MALGAELAERFNERLALASYRMLFTQVGTLICLGGGFMLFFVPTDHHAHGQLNQDVYTPFALFCGSIVVLTVLTSAVGTQGRALAVERRGGGGNAPTSDKMTPSMFAARIWGAFKTKNFRRLLFTLLIIGLFSGTQNVIALHLNTYFWEFTPRDSQFSFYAQILGFFLGLPFSRSLANTFDKKGALFLCVGASCTLACVPVCLRLLGWFPPNGDPVVLVWVSLARGAFGFLGTTSIVLIQAMLADTADEYELSQGVRAQGLLFGAQSFSSKASSGAGAALGGDPRSDSVSTAPHCPRSVAGSSDETWLRLRPCAPHPSVCRSAEYVTV